MLLNLIKNIIIIAVIFLGLTSCSERFEDGYLDQVSYRAGDEMKVYLNAESPGNKNIRLYDLSGKVVAEKTADVSAQKMSTDVPWEKGYHYNKTFSFEVPDLPSGVYLWEDKIPFVLKGTSSKKITVVYPSNTVNAYNNRGGKSTYGYNCSDKIPANIVSFHRPQDFDHKCYSKEFLSWLWNETDYEVNYLADIDMDDYKNIEGTELLILPGHSEYWTRKARINFDKFVEKGGDAIVLSGNTMYWQVRYSDDGNQMIAYKDVAFEEDPIADSLLITGLWDDPRLNYPTISSIGANFNNGGFGKKTDNGWDGYKIVSEKSPLLEGTHLKNGDIIKLPTTEYDGAPLIKSGKEFVLDLKAMGAYKGELIGYDLGYREGQTTGTFFVYQKVPTSGIIINAGSTNWCNEDGIEGEDGEIIKIITINMIDKLLNGKSVFSE